MYRQYQRIQMQPFQREYWNSCEDLCCGRSSEADGNDLEVPSHGEDAVFGIGVKLRIQGRWMMCYPIIREEESFETLPREFIAGGGSGNTNGFGLRCSCFDPPEEQDWYPFKAPTSCYIPR